MKNSLTVIDTGLDEGTLEQIKTVFSKFDILEKVVLYGSRAKGTFKPYSDIDITLFGDGLTLTYQQEIEIALDDLFLPFKFDISCYDTIQNEDLKEHIERVGIILYSK